MRSFIFLVILFFLSAGSNAANIMFHDLMDPPFCGGLSDRSCISILIRGKIEKGDAGKLEAEIHRLNKVVPKELKKPISVGYVLMDSNGGDVHAAIKLGEAIRKNLLAVQVTQDSVCYSACVIAFLGGVQRFPFGPIGIHSFYSEEIIGEPDYVKANAKYNRVSDDIELYLKNMRIPISVLDEMKKVSHKGLKTLSFEELRDLSIVGFDPVYRQMRDTQ